METQPHTPESGDKQEYLLDVAERLFAEHGFDGTSTRMIADEANMNVAMISYYFGSKEKMFEHLIRTKVAHMRKLSEQLAEMNDRDPWQKMEYLIEGYTDRIVNTQASFHKLMMRELSLRKRPEIVEMIEERVSTNMKIIRNVLIDGIRAGIFREETDFSMVMVLIFGTINHTVSAKSLILKISVLEGKQEHISPEQLREKVKQSLKTVMARYMLKNPAQYNYQ
jgi:AcrR family transcriptional regulator